MNGDGLPDILVGEQSGDREVVWFSNQGSLSFNPTPNLVTGQEFSITDLNAIDLDGDGDQDILAAANTENSVVRFVNDGTGTFTTRLLTSNAQGARSVHFADFDGDNDLDVVSVSETDGKVAWYENVEPGLSLIADYSFSDNALDSGANAKNGTVNGATATTDRFGIPNFAFSFDGANDYIETDPVGNNVLDSGVRGTISAWFNLVDFDASEDDVILSYSTTTSSNSFAALAIDGDSLSFLGIKKMGLLPHQVSTFQK